jgi:hypothetical protein
LISKPSRKPISAIETIIEHVVIQLIEEAKIDEENAINTFYNSDIFTQLTDEATNLYLKSWQEIYEILKTELKKQ